MTQCRIILGEPICVSVMNRGDHFIILLVLHKLCLSKVIISRSSWMFGVHLHLRARSALKNLLGSRLYSMWLLSRLILPLLGAKHTIIPYSLLVNRDQVNP